MKVATICQRVSWNSGTRPLSSARNIEVSAKQTAAEMAKASEANMAKIVIKPF
jgi:hypothetical protein